MQLVILKEQHSLLPQQVELLRPGYEILSVPAQGWSKQEMRDLVEARFNADEGAHQLVFASPVPYLLALAVREITYTYATTSVLYRMGVYLFHNDRREKIELPGKTISVTAKEGWELLYIVGK